MKELESLVREFFNLSLITVEDLTVEQEEKGIYAVHLKTPDSGIVIGPHGKNMSVFSNIIKLMIAKKLDSRVKVHFEVNDYGKQKEEKFFNFIESKIEAVAKTGKDIKLPFLTSYERKKVHGFVSDKNDSDIFTKSIGEGRERRLFICKKDTTSTLDIDGIDI